MARRLIVALFALAAFASAGTASAGERAGRIDFELFRGGAPFGRQSVVVTQTADGLIAETSADLHAGLGPVTLFSYTQRCRETWRGGALVGLRCTTRQDGRTKTASGEAANGAIRITGTAGAASFDPATLPTSWWTRPSLGTREMINTENGARLPVRVTMVGRETLTLGGQSVATEHIRVYGTVPVDLWYDAQGRWVSCAFTIRGQHITYRLTSPPGAGPS